MIYKSGPAMNRGVDLLPASVAKHIIWQLQRLSTSTGKYQTASSIIKYASHGHVKASTCFVYLPNSQTSAAYIISGKSSSSQA